jgi:hypothetical protein
MQPQICTPWKYLVGGYLKTVYYTQFLGMIIKYILNFIFIDALNKYCISLLYVFIYFNYAFCKSHEDVQVNVGYSRYRLLPMVTSNAVTKVFIKVHSM